MTKTYIIKFACDDNSIYWENLLSDDIYKGEHRGFAVSNSYGNNYMHGWTCSDESLSDVLEAFNGFSGCPEDVEYFMECCGVKIAGNRTQFYKALTASLDDSENACNVLNLIFGGSWKYTTLHGCSQGDWCDCLYNAAVITPEDLSYIQAVYFNTGYELGVIENSEKDPDELSIDDIEYWDYTDKWKDEDIISWFGFLPGSAVVLEDHTSTITVHTFS